MSDTTNWKYKYLVSFTFGTDQNVGFGDVVYMADSMTPTEIEKVRLAIKEKYGYDQVTIICWHRFDNDDSE